jgi:hypothetical protein
MSFMPSINGEGATERCITVLQERERNSTVTIGICSKFVHTN